MKIREFFSKNKKKVILISVILAAAVIIAVCVLIYFLRNEEETPFSFMQGTRSGGLTISGDMISASGVTSVGMTQENFEVENLETTLLIEEVYVSSGEEIEEGTKILKVSEDTVEEAREELEGVLREAKLAYRAGAIEYEQSKITAVYDRDAAILSGEQALAVYNATIAGLESSVESAQEELDEAKADIAEYQAAAEGNTYYEYYKVGEYKELYDENLKLLIAKMDEWGVSWSQVTSGGGSGMSSTASGSVSGGDAGGSTNNNYATVLASLYKVLEQNLEDYEQALDDYEDAELNAGFELQTLELGLSTLEKNLTEARVNYETRILDAKLTYETSLANAERAENDYETALEKAESDYESLKDASEEAEENLNLFENSIGDGYYYAAGSGTILRAMVRAEQYLTSDSTIFVYSNPEEMSVTVSVDQSDIASITVGDSAYVESSDYGGFQGVVTQINPVSSSSSQTSVTYNVTVTLSDNAANLTANQSVTVIFGLGGMGNEQE